MFQDESQNTQVKTFQNQVMKTLTVHQAVTEHKLVEMISSTDNLEEQELLTIAISNLLRKGMIEFVTDKTQSMYVYRLKQVLH